MFHVESHTDHGDEEGFGFFDSISSSTETPVHSNKPDAVMGTSMFGGGGFVFGNDMEGRGSVDDGKDADTTMMPPPPVTTTMDRSDKENSNEHTRVDTTAATTTTTSKAFQSLLVQVNEGLEGCLAHHKQTTKRFFAALEEWSQTAAQVHAEWTPLQEQEHAEADRLSNLQGEVHGSVQAFFANNNNAGAVGGGQ